MITTSNGPVLSIIVTAHNCEDYLEQCLNSLETPAGETPDGSEIILIDDDSEDRSPEICRNFSQKHANVTFFPVKFRNIGMVRNFALAQCSGQYVTMIDGDDRVIRGALSDISRVLNERKPDLLLTRLNEVYDASNIKCQWTGLEASAITRDEAITKFLVHREVQAHFIGQFIRRDILSGLSFPEFRCYEDAYLFPYVLAICNTILFARSGPYLYFKRKSSLSVDIDAEKVSMLIQATDQMAVAFGEGYENLIACHWINIQHRHNADITDERDRAHLRGILNQISSVSFLCDTRVRLSFKKKYLKLRLMRAI
ncbi:glycosyltransferase family 2 protein [Pseudomonas cerasi]